MTITFPGNRPESNVTVASLLKDPTVIEGRVFQQDTQFLSTFMYGAPVQAVSGQVEYEIARQDNLYAARGDAEIVEPGAEFPMLDIGFGQGRRANTEKFGTGFIVTYEAIRRNNFDPLAQGVTKVRNHIVRMDAQRALNAVEVAVAEFGQSTAASAVWSTDEAAYNDLGAALASGIAAGYQFDTLLVNPQDAYLMTRAADIRDATKYTDTRATANIYNSPLAPVNGLLGLDVVTNRFVAPGKAYLLERNTAGKVAVEQDFRLDFEEQKLTQRWVAVGSLVSVPVVTEPGAVQVITGISA